MAHKYSFKNLIQTNHAVFHQDGILSKGLLLRLSLSFLIVLHLAPLGLAAEQSLASDNQTTNSAVEAYLDEAQQLHLADSNEWLKLLHYEISTSVFAKKFRSKFRGPFYIAPDGTENPENEMKSSLRLLFSPKTRFQQCKYLSRTKFFVRKLKIQTGDIEPCAERKAWKQELNAQAISLIFASADLSNAASSFGHTFLKLSNPSNKQKKELLDYGINYAADANQSEGVLFALKGLFGLYNGKFTMLPYHQKIREYINAEGRDIWEYALNFSAEEVDDLIDHLIELEGSSAPYYFLDENCSYQLLAALEAVRPELNLTAQFKYFTIPIDSLKRVMAVTGLVKTQNFRKSLKNKFTESLNGLSLKQTNAIKKLIIQGAEIDYKIPDADSFTKIEQTEILDATLNHLALRAFKNNTNLENEIYNVSVQRARLQTISREMPVTEPPPPQATHDSSASYVSFYRNNQIDFLNFRFRHAYHDFISDDSGGIPFSQNNVLALEIGFNSEARQLQLIEFDFLDLLSSNPVTPFEYPLTWKSKLSLQKNWRPQFDAGAGVSYDLFSRSRILLFISEKLFALSQASPELAALQLGPDFTFATHINRDLRFALSTRYWVMPFGPNESDRVAYFDSHQKTEFEYEINFGLSLSRNQEIQIKFKKSLDSEFKFSFVSQFIL